MGILRFADNLIYHCGNLIKFKSGAVTASPISNRLRLIKTSLIPFNHFVLMILAAPLLSGCQISYLIKNAYNQMGLLNSRVPIEKALQDDQLTDAQKRKLILAQKAHEFA
jgi:predicted aminopeptidase